MVQRGTLKFEHNLGADRPVCAPSLGAPSCVIAISEAENRKKWSIVNRYISVTTKIDEKKFVFFEHTTYDLYHGQ